MTEEQRRRLQALNTYRQTTPLKVTVAPAQNLIANGKVYTRDPNARTSAPAAQPPPPKSLVAPRQNIIQRARDVVDANSELDQYKRIIAGQKAIVENPGNLATATGGLIKQAVKDTFQPAAAGIARLIPGGQNDIAALERSQQVNDEAMKTYSSLYRQGKMSKETYTKALRSLGEGYGSNSKEAQRIADTADRSQAAGSFAQVAAAPFSLAGFGAKTVAGRVAGEALIGGGYGLLNEASAKKDPTLKGAAQNAGIGILSGAAAPILGSVVGRVAKARTPKAVKQALKEENLPDEYAELLSREQDPKAIQAIITAAREAEQEGAELVAPTVTNNLPRTPDGEVPVESLNGLKNSIKNEPTGVKPGGVERAVQEIENGTALPVRVRTLDDGTQVIEDGRHRIEAANRLGLTSFPVEDVSARYKPETPPTPEPAPEAVAAAPATQAEALEQAVADVADGPLVAANPETSTAAITASRSTFTPPETANGEVTGLTPDQLVAEAVNAAEASKGRYGEYSRTQKIKDVIDPRNRAVAIDRAVAQDRGVGRRDIGADESLDAAIERTSQSKQIADEMLKGSDIEAIIKSTGGDKQAARDFNLYRLFKRDIEQRLDGRPALNVNENGQAFSVEDMQRFIDEYEASVPDADAALRAMSQEIQQAQDWAAEVGVVPKEDLARARLKKDGTPYQYYTPATRALPEDKIGPSIAASNVGTIGRQKVLQDFTGSMIPVDPSFKSVTDYVETLVRQANQTKVSQLYAKRVQQGFIPDARIIQTGDEAARLDSLRATQRELQEVATSVQKELTRTRGSARVAGQRVKTAESKLRTADTRASLNEKAALKEASQRETAAVNKAKEVLKKSIAADDPDAAAALDSLSSADFLDILRYSTQDELFSKGVSGKGKLKTAETAAQRAQKASETTKSQQAALDRIAKTSEAHAALVEKATDLRLDLASLKTAKQGVREQIVELRPDPFTGQQTILGRDTNGNPFRIEVPPEDANLLQGFNNENINDVLKLVGAAQRPFREAFTGILNLPFQMAQATFNTFMLPITSREGIKAFAPRSIEAAVRSFTRNDEFQQALTKSGAIRYSGGFNQLPKDEVSDAIAAQATKLGKLQWNANPKRAWNQISQLGGRLDVAARTAAADAVKRASLAAGKSYDEAIADAVYEYNNALPNFANASSFVKGLDNAVMYTNPSISGTRTLFRVFRDNPAKTTAKLGAGALGLTGTLAYSLAQDNGQEFYADMHRAGKDYILDNNVVIVLPGASKNEKTGEWDGIIKIPLAPEVRPVNRAVRQAFDTNKTGQDPKTYARAMFDFLTGQIASSSNPVANTAAGIATGKDPRSGYDIYDETLSPEDKRKQIEKYLVGSFGTVGRTIASGGKEGLAKPFIDKVYGAKGISAGGNFYKTQDEAIKAVGLNKNELDAYRGTVSPTSKDLAGNAIKEKTYYDSASKALTWLRYPKTFEVSKQIDAANRKAGKPGDPIFDLPEDRRKLVITLQSNPSPGNKEEKAIARLNPWISDFYKQRSAYYDQVKSTLSKEDQKKFGIDPNGITTPTAPPSVQERMNFAGTLADAKAKAAIYREPEVADYLADQNAYQRAKRAFLGLPQFDEYPTPPPNVQKYMDQYSSLPKGNGPPKRDGTPSSPQRSAWIKSHPNEWAAMSSAFDKIGAWTAADEGALAVYEGINAEGDAGGDTATGGNSFAYGGSNYKYDSNGNIVEDSTRKKLYLSQQVANTTDLTKMPELSRSKSKVVPFKVNKPKIPVNNKRLRLRV